MVQLGLCAFRSGIIPAAHNALHDIWSGGRVKELLAQGLAQRKQVEKTADELKNEKKRQIPFHMHINIELLECVYYVSSMLLEIPHMAESVEVSSRVISKPFRRQLDYFTRQVFNGTKSHSPFFALISTVFQFLTQRTSRKCS
jgi:translation initiation factor 3 subunit C